MIQCECIKMIQPVYQNDTLAVYQNETHFLLHITIFYIIIYIIIKDK